MSKKIPTFTDEQVIEALRAVVAEKGADYVYPKNTRSFTRSCTYLRNRQPSCIVGHVLVRLGVPKAALARVEGRSAFSILNNFGDGPAVAEMSEHAINALDEAQRRQDAGETWAAATDKALYRCFRVPLDPEED